MDFAQDPYDETLLSALERYDGLKNTTKKNGHSLTVIHLMGSHVFYNQRYPQTFDFFKAKDMKECLTDDAKSQKAAYLNTLRYTDHLLEKMIKHYSSQRALVFYFSDHGDMIDEPLQRGFFGHGTNVDHPTIDIPSSSMLHHNFAKSIPNFGNASRKLSSAPSPRLGSPTRSPVCWASALNTTTNATISSATNSLTLHALPYKETNDTPFHR